MKKIDLDKFVKDKTLGYFYVYLPNHELANGSGKVYNRKRNNEKSRNYRT